MAGDPIGRLRAYLCAAASEGAAVIVAPPFTIAVRHDGRDDAIRAIIQDPPRDGLEAALARLRAVVPAGSGETVVTALADGLAGPEALSAAGLVAIERTGLLVATPGTLRPAPAVPGLAIAILDAASDLAAVRENLDTNERGFDPAAPPTTDEAAAAFRAGLRGNRAFSAHLGGRAVGAGMFNPPRDGVAELAGITTLAGYRRRGVATALTALAARTAFALGCDLVFLGARTDEARRIYERLGFRPVATQIDGRLPRRADER